MTDYKKVVKQRFCDLFCSYLSKYHRSFSYKQKKKLYRKKSYICNLEKTYLIKK